MKTVEWADIQDYIAAGDLMKVTMGADLDAMTQICRECAQTVRHVIPACPESRKGN